jgi:Patatin-like phospholipase
MRCRRRARAERTAVDVTGDDGATALLYDGKTVTKAGPATAAMALNMIAAARDEIVARTGIRLPLAGFSSPPSGKACSTGATTGEEIDTLTIDSIPRRQFWRARLLSLALLAALVVGCTATERQAPAPAFLSEQVTVLGLPNAHFWPDTQGAAMVHEAEEALKRERAAGAEAAGPDGRLPPVYFLAISGGGDDGAFGAGLLVGWSDNGTRPIFKLVTGVSTGAMMAPFAFLGRPYDDKLRAMYGQIKPDDIYTNKGLYGVLFGDSLKDTAPLFRLISSYVDDRMMADIAREYQRGRLLLIGTTNLDTQRPVIWNIGAIAASGRPGALELIRKILLASASMPGIFPPTMIDVEAGGRTYQEMHVDGGAVVQTFLYPPEIGRLVNMKSGQFARERHAYVVRNGRLDPDWASVDRRFLTISGRAIATMIHYSGYNDILRIYSTTQHDGVDYNLAYIAPDFPDVKHEDFDPTYLHALFDYGYQQGRKGYNWHKAPPIFHSANPQSANPSPERAGPAPQDGKATR